MTALVPRLRPSGWMSRPAGDLMERFFGNFGLEPFFTREEEWMPPLDVAETENEMIVRIEIPGMNEKDVDISLSHGMLSVSGEKRVERSANETCHCMESGYGKFNRTVSIPFEVDADKVDASFRDGVLRIRLPKSETAKPRKIEIKT